MSDLILRMPWNTPEAKAKLKISHFCPCSGQSGLSNWLVQLIWKCTVELEQARLEFAGKLFAPATPKFLKSVDLTVDITHINGYPSASSLLKLSPHPGGAVLPGRLVWIEKLLHTSWKPDKHFLWKFNLLISEGLHNDLAQRVISSTPHCKEGNALIGFVIFIRCVACSTISSSSPEVHQNTTGDSNLPH